MHVLFFIPNLKRFFSVFLEIKHNFKNFRYSTNFLVFFYFFYFSDCWICDICQWLLLEKFYDPLKFSQNDWTKFAEGLRQSLHEIRITCFENQLLAWCVMTTLIKLQNLVNLNTISKVIVIVNCCFIYYFLWIIFKKNFPVNIFFL